MNRPDCEEWKDIRGYEGHYKVSNLGRVKSLAREDSIGRNLKERILKFSLDSEGYPYIILCKNGRVQGFNIHRLVAKAFIPNTENKPEINHKNGIKTDIKVENFEWCFRRENIAHAMTTGLTKTKLTESDVLQIKESNLSRKELAKIFLVSQTHVSDIRNNKRWKHL